MKSITENYDPETPQGFLYEGMIEVINQFYSMNLATETMKGMRENAERGYHNGGRVPYGYRLEKVTDDHGREHSKLVPGPDDEVATVREIFRLAVEENRGTRGISRILNERGVPGPLGPHWNQSSVGHILNNRTYVGDTSGTSAASRTAAASPRRTGSSSRTRTSRSSTASSSSAARRWPSSAPSTCARARAGR